MAAKPRPGGRSARTKTAVFDAVAALVIERGHAAVTMTEIAERAGLAATSLYRRWGDVRALVMAVAVEQLMREHPLPDTGSLEGDLRAWSRSIVASLRRPEQSQFFVAFIATAATPNVQGSTRMAALQPRLDQIVSMLERAKTRGENPPPVFDVLDQLLAPLYGRALFGAPIGDDLADRLVERLLSQG